MTTTCLGGYWAWRAAIRSSRLGGGRMHQQSFAVTDIRPDNKVIDMRQGRMRQRAVASPAFTASLVDAIDALREIAGIDPDPGPSAQWWDKLDWYLRGRQRRNDQGPNDPAEYF